MLYIIIKVLCLGIMEFVHDNSNIFYSSIIHNKINFAGWLLWHDLLIIVNDKWIQIYTDVSSNIINSYSGLGIWTNFISKECQRALVKSHTNSEMKEFNRKYTENINVLTIFFQLKFVDPLCSISLLTYFDLWRA